MYNSLLSYIYVYIYIYMYKYIHTYIYIYHQQRNKQPTSNKMIHDDADRYSSKNIYIEYQNLSTIKHI